ncbi:MAG: sigma-70 family RNA polymerase sigma factor [Gemmataceae bacterium]
MAAVHLHRFVRQLRGTLAVQDAARLGEAELWERYVRERDDVAFDVLVRRHGPMVLGVCRRILRNDHDAEDAFQATFLVLARRIAALRSPAALANWLYGVARRTALHARRAAETRRAKEAAVPPRVPPTDDRDDLWQALDHELGRLADKYRTPIVLCDLEGKTRKEAARQLGGRKGPWRAGWPAAAASWRSDSAVAVSPARCWRRRSRTAWRTGGVPSALVAATVSAASHSAHGALSAAVAVLTEGVLRSMFASKLKTAAAWVLLVGGASLGTGVLIAQGPGTDPWPANLGELRDWAAELRQQLRQIEEKVARLERDATPRRDDPPPPAALPAPGHGRDRLLGNPRRRPHRDSRGVGHAAEDRGGRRLRRPRPLPAAARPARQTLLLRDDDGGIGSRDDGGLPDRRGGQRDRRVRADARNGGAGILSPVPGRPGPLFADVRERLLRHRRHRAAGEDVVSLRTP